MPGNPDRAADLHQLAEIWEGLGLHVLEMPGWEQRGRSSNNTFEVLGCHHTGDPFDTDRILRDGRPDLNGPLCNVALHGNGEVVLVASGLANHFGAATWPNGRSLGVEATGPQKTGPKFPNYDAYVALAAGFCIFKGGDPRRVVRDDVGIPIHLVAGHKEVAVDKKTRTIYGRKSDPAFEGQQGRMVNGKLSHGFSVNGSLQLLDTFRDQVHARMTAGEGGISIVDADTKAYLDKQFESIRGRVDRALQRIGGRTNSIYNERNEDFKDLVMAREALEAANQARRTAEKVAADLERLSKRLRRDMVAGVEEPTGVAEPDA